MVSRRGHGALSFWLGTTCCSESSQSPKGIGSRIQNCGKHRRASIGRYRRARSHVISGTRKVACVKIGEIPIALSTCDEGFLDLLRQRYDGFLSSSPPEFELEFDLTSTRPGSDDDVRVRRDGDEWLRERGKLRAPEANRTRRSGPERRRRKPAWCCGALSHIL